MAIVRANVGNSAFELEWNLSGQNIEGNYSDISWQAVIRTNGMRYYSNAVKIVGGGINGNSIGGGTWSNIYGDRQLLSGNMRIYHEADGRKSFYADIAGWLYGTGQNSAGAWFELPTIPRASQPSWSKGRYVIGEDLVVNMNRKAGFTHRGTVQIPDNNDVKSFENVGDNFVWRMSEDEKDIVYKRMKDSFSMVLGVDITTWSGGTRIGEGKWANAEIVVNADEVRPDFSEFVWSVDSKTKSILGNNSGEAIKGVSKVSVRVNNADKMVVKKYASAVSYIVGLDGKSEEKADGSGDIVFNDILVESSGDLLLSVEAKDSRGLKKAVSKSVKVLDYSVMSINVSGKRNNNFDKTTKIDISGNYTALGGRNRVVKLRYRWKVEGGSFGEWKNAVYSGNDGAFNANSIYLELESANKYIVEVEGEDLVGKSVVSSAVVEAGVPILFISDNKKKVGVGKVPNLGGENDLDVAGDIYSRGKKTIVSNPVYFESWRDGSRWDGQVISANSSAIFRPDKIVKNLGGFIYENGAVTVPEEGVYLISATAICCDVAVPIALMFQVGEGANWRRITAEDYNSYVSLMRGITTSTIAWLEKGEKLQVVMCNFAENSPTRYGSWDERKARLTILKQY